MKEFLRRLLDMLVRFFEWDLRTGEADKRAREADGKKTK